MANEDNKLEREHATAVASWFLTLCQTFESYGLDVPALMASANLPSAADVDPNARIPIQKMQIVWQRAVEMSGDDAIGIQVAKYIQPTTLNALGMSLWTSDTLRDAWQRLLQYYELISDVLNMTVETSATAAALCFNRVPGNECANEAIDAFMATGVQLAFEASGRRIHPVAVHFERSAHLNQEPIVTTFVCEVLYDQKVNQLIYTNEQLDQPLATANKALAQQYDDIARTVLRDTYESVFIVDVRRLMMTALDSGEPNKENIASELALSSRSLQRKLEAEGTSYGQLLKETRYSLAKILLSDESLSIMKISDRLGFKDAGSFSKAFKGWASESPRSFRLRLQSKE